MCIVICKIQVLCKEIFNLPNKIEFVNWLFKIFSFLLIKTEITIRIVSIKEISLINYIYRGINSPTNILSFLYDIPNKFKSYLLGDLIICNKILEKEFCYKYKSFKNYWIYILIHGILHLLGYKHNSKKELIEMEILELILLNRLNL